MHAVRAALGTVADRTGSERIIAKRGLDFATGTDLASQEVVRDVLRHAHPEHAFVGEESGLDAAPDAGSYWLVDPICGTRNFASRLPLYSINVALVEQHHIVVGAVADGAHGHVYVAEHGRGAWLVAQDGLVPIWAGDGSATVAMDPGAPGGPAADKASRVIGAAIRSGRWALRTLGTSLDLAYLAQGSLAGVWHFSRIHPLHFAAGVLLAREAGALVTDESGGPWTLESQGLVAAATPVTHAALLALAPAAASSGR